MPGSITVKDRTSMAHWARQKPKGEKSTFRFTTLPCRLELEHPGQKDSVARFLVEVPEEVGEEAAHRQMEYVVRASDCEFAPGKIESKIFRYQPPEKPDYSKGVLVEDAHRYNRMVRDYGVKPRGYYSLTYEVRGPRAQQLLGEVLEDAEQVRYLEVRHADGDYGGVYYEHDNPMSGTLFTPSTIQAGEGDFTRETFAFLAADEANEGLDFDLEEDWLTIGDHGIPIQL